MKFVSTYKKSSRHYNVHNDNDSDNDEYDDSMISGNWSSDKVSVRRYMFLAVFF